MSNQTDFENSANNHVNFNQTLSNASIAAINFRARNKGEFALTWNQWLVDLIQNDMDKTNWTTPQYSNELYYRTSKVDGKLHPFIRNKMRVDSLKMKDWLYNMPSLYVSALINIFYGYKPVENDHQGITSKGFDISHERFNATRTFNNEVIVIVIEGEGEGEVLEEENEVEVLEE